MEYSGGCLCGAVRFHLKGTVKGFYFCHCTRCQRSSGSAHGSNLFFSDANLVWEKGEEFCAQYTHEGTRFSKCFCTQCGCPLPRVFDGKKGSIVVPAGCLDGDQDFEPTAHIFTDSKKSWEEKLPQAIKFTGLPK
jgi:hypothetical protein